MPTLLFKYTFLRSVLCISELYSTHQECSRTTCEEGSCVAQRAGTARMDQLPGGGTLLRAIAYDPMEMRRQRTAEGRASGQEREDPLPEPQGFHGGAGRRCGGEVALWSEIVRSIPIRMEEGRLA